MSSCAHIQAEVAIIISYLKFQADSGKILFTKTYFNTSWKAGDLIRSVKALCIIKVKLIVRLSEKKGGRGKKKRLAKQNPTLL